MYVERELQFGRVRKRYRYCWERLPCGRASAYTMEMHPPTHVTGSIIDTVERYDTIEEAESATHMTIGNHTALAKCISTMDEI